MSKSDKSKNAVLPATLSDKSGVFRIAHITPHASLCIIALKYLWLLLFFAILYVIVIVLMISSGSYVPKYSLVGCVIAFVFFFSYVGLLECFLFKDFVLRQSGITLPFVYYWKAFGRLNRSWSELNSVTFSRSYRYDITRLKRDSWNRGDGAPSSVEGGVPEVDFDIDFEDPADQVVLTFLDSSAEGTVNIHIKLKEINQLDLKKLVYAIVTNAPHAVIEPALDKVALEFPTVSGIKHLNFSSFTNLWDEEFSTRYSPTLFVPLSPDDELRSGTIKISELVACGGSAAIYAAKDAEGQQIIVKEAVIPKNANAELKAKAIEMFNREALLLSKLNHPNIAKVLDHFVENEHHYEVIEFIDGLDLRRFVKERGPQPEDFVLNWAEQICELLVYLHSQEPPIIHRDLTPDNLVLRVDAQLVLIDFGAANAFVGTATGTMVGKQSYMPPEQLRGKAVPQSDIYSLGGTLYFLLTGRDPTPLEVSQVDNSKVSVPLNQLLARCTAFEVSNRYASAVELLQAIRTIRKQRQVAVVSQ